MNEIEIERYQDEINERAREDYNPYNYVSELYLETISEDKINTEFDWEKEDSSV
tara:strand:- start:2554 stop:2715 length:162 start_codon:yes stop_codon:yes gene_type:complete